MIEFHVNGKKYQKPEPMAVEQVLKELSIITKGAIVEYNQEFLPSEKYAGTLIKSGDKLEIIRAFAGG